MKCELCSRELKMSEWNYLLVGEGGDLKKFIIVCNRCKKAIPKTLDILCKLDLTRLKLT